MIDKTSLNDTIITTILKHIPKNIKPIVYLMELLHLSRESVYRRIRKEIPFSLDELSDLSYDLGFSIDEIIEESKKEHVFFNLQSKIALNSSNAFISMFQEFYSYQTILLNAKKSNVYMAINTIPPMFSVCFEHLFKFFYYKWLSENNKNLPKCYYSNLVLPPELVSLHEKFDYTGKQFSSNILIMSPTIFLSTIQDIQYFHQRKLINDEELQLLNKDMHNLIDFVENMAKTGISYQDLNINIYLSVPYINSNSVYMEYDNSVETHLWMYPTSPIIIHNQNVCDIQKKWFQSLKKQSILITQSNEILQEQFFDKQREYINQTQIQHYNRI